MMISCKDATELVIRKKHQDLTGYDKLRLWFHLMMCRFCKLFEKQNKIIDKASQEIDRHYDKKLPEKKKQEILEEIMNL